MRTRDGRQQQRGRSRGGGTAGEWQPTTTLPQHVVCGVACSSLPVGVSGSLVFSMTREQTSLGIGVLSLPYHPNLLFKDVKLVVARY